MIFEPRLYDGMWWVTKIEGSLEIRICSVGKNKVKCEEECDSRQALYAAWWDHSDLTIQADQDEIRKLKKKLSILVEIALEFLPFDTVERALKGENINV